MAFTADAVNITNITTQSILMDRSYPKNVKRA